MIVGRNDPCPCGSGKKFKRCHGAAAERPAVSPRVARANALKDCDADLADRLMRWARRHLGASWGAALSDPTSGAFADGLSEADLPIVMPWLLHMRLDDSATTIEDLWRRDPQTRVSPDAAAIMDAYAEAWVSIWEVSSVEPGTGVQLVDVLTRETRFVDDVSSSHGLRPFDAILAIVLTCDGVSFLGGMHGQPLPPRFAEVAAREARRLCHVRTKKVAPEKLRSPGMQMALFALWSGVVDLMTTQPPPVMQNTDGDPMQLTSDDYSLAGSRDDVVRALASLPGAEEPEAEAGKTVFTVTKPGNARNKSWDNTIVARIVLAATRLTVETNSVRRADAMRAAIEGRLAGLVRFRLRKEENTAQMVAAAMEGAAKTRGAPRRDGREEPIDSDTLAAVREFRERHMRAWVEESIPALGGLTPREAARSPRVRPRLESLLKEFVQHEAAYPEAQRIELDWMWEELGLN